MPRVIHQRAHRNFPNAIGARRVGMEMTQVELAEKVGVTRGTLSTWESGLTLPSPAKTAKLVAILGREIYQDWVWEVMARLDGAS